MTVQRPDFTNIIPNGRGVRNEEEQINQLESWQRRGASVEIPRDNVLPHGVMYITSSAATSVTAGTWMKVAGTATFADGSFFDMPTNNRMRCRLSVERHFVIQINNTLTSDTNNTEVYMKIYKNGTGVDATRIDRKVGTATDIGAAALGGIVPMKWGDYVELWIDTDKNASITVSRMSFMVFPYS